MRRIANVSRPPPAFALDSQQLTAIQGITLTARAEAQIAVYSAQRPSTAASTASTGLSPIVPSLLAAIDAADSPALESFQATVCLAWLHHVLGEPELAAARLPGDFGAVATQLSSEAGALSGWVRVCLVKGTYLKGTGCKITAYTTCVF